MVKFSNFEFPEFDDDFHFFCFGPEMFFSKIFIPIIEVVTSFCLSFFSSCFHILVKIPENASALQDYLLINNTE